MSNPMFRDNMYQEAVLEEGQMTVTGSILKTFILLAIAFVSATYTWFLTMTEMSDKANVFVTGGIIAGIISVLISSFKPKLSNIFSPIYAFAEGLALGGISAVYNSVYNGIVLNAIFATMITLGIMLFLYASKIIQATSTFRKIVVTSTLSIVIFYLLVIIASAFRIQFLSPFISAYDNIFVIGFVIIVASMNLILDFDFIEKGAQNYMPKYFEWYGAMGLMVTLVWLYIEFLKLLSRLRKD